MKKELIGDCSSNLRAGRTLDTAVVTLSQTAF